MAQHNYSTVTPRIGKMAGAMLATAIPHEVLGITGELHRVPKNRSDTVIFRRLIPTGGATTNATTINQWVVDANAHRTVEGQTPEADTLNYQDITVVLEQYACLYKYSDKTRDLYEDDIPAHAKIQTGRRMALLKEKIREGALLACTNRFYGGGTSRATVDGVATLSGFRKISQNILGNRGDTITQVVSGSQNYGTSPIEASFIVFASHHLENDLRQIPGFKETAVYGSNRGLVHTRELGSFDRFRVVLTAELSPILNAGAAVGSTGLVSTGGSLIDVYPIIVVGANAWGDVALRGMDSFTVIDLPPTKSTADPLGQTGHVGAIFWSAMFVQNDGWMAVYEVGASNLTA